VRGAVCDVAGAVTIRVIGRSRSELLKLLLLNLLLPSLLLLHETQESLRTLLAECLVLPRLGFRVLLFLDSLLFVILSLAFSFVGSLRLHCGGIFPTRITPIKPLGDVLPFLRGGLRLFCEHVKSYVVEICQWKLGGDNGIVRLRTNRFDALYKWVSDWFCRLRLACKGPYRQDAQDREDRDSVIHRIIRDYFTGSVVAHTPERGELMKVLGRRCVL
jgi:hypothetical protein